MGRKKHANQHAKGNWKTVDLSEYELEGFEDGNALELEELTGK